jgi:hypothetical protein
MRIQPSFFHGNLKLMVRYSTFEKIEIIIRQLGKEPESPTLIAGALIPQSKAKTLADLSIEARGSGKAVGKLSDVECNFRIT